MPKDQSLNFSALVMLYIFRDNINSKFKSLFFMKNHVIHIHISVTCQYEK